MFVMLLCAAMAHGDDGPTLQRIHELAWQRVDALILAGQIPGADAPTRAEAALALGRLGTPEALVVLEDLRTDTDVEVQVSVAQALGWVPGGERVVRDWLDELGGAPGFDRVGPGVRRYGALVRALGASGDARDVPRMVEALREPWPTASVAASGIAAMAARAVDGVTDAAPALVSRLRGPDPRVVADAARALSIVGLGVAPSRSDVALVRERIRRGTTPTVQAALVRAVWPHLSTEERGELFLHSVTDTSRALQVSALSVLQPGDLPADVLSSFLVDSDPWVRDAALTALARDPSAEATDALRRYAAEAAPWDGAQALAALGIRDDARASDVEEHAAVRTALVGLVLDRRLLETWALEDPEPRVRTVAAARLQRVGNVATWTRMLDAEDPMVRWFAVRSLAESGAMRAVARHIGSEGDHGVLTEALTALAEVPARVSVDRRFTTVLVRAASSASPALRRAGESLARAVGATWPDSRPVKMPDVAAARGIRGAVVLTDRGSFRVSLEPELAPLAVTRWAELAEAGFYDHMAIWSAKPAAEVRTGCPRGDGYGDGGVVSPAEVTSTAFGAGTVALAAHHLGGVGSQWFVATGDRPDRSAPHTRIGRVVQGQHVVDRLQPGDRILSVLIERVAR